MNQDENGLALIDDEAATDAALQAKLADASTPGYQVELDPNEAEAAGAFAEDALSERDAMDSAIDLPDSGRASS